MRSTVRWWLTDSPEMGVLFRQLPEQERCREKITCCCCSDFCAVVATTLRAWSLKEGTE